jgi:hypothetical protein
MSNITTEAPKGAKKPKTPKVVRESIQKRSLRYFFCDDEKLELARRLAEKHKEVGNLEDERQRANKDYQSRIKGVENDIAILSEKVREGYEFRETEIRVTYDKPEPGKKTIVRLDTKETVGVEVMTNEEKQTSFAEKERTFAEAESAKKAKTAAPAADTPKKSAGKPGVVDVPADKQ